MPSRSRNIVLTVVFFAVALLGTVSTVDDAGREHTATATKRALAAFGLARGINAAISAVQGTEVALQPAGVGLTLTPGELLDPVNDLVERFSAIMLASTVSLGIQQLLLALGGSVTMRVVLALALAAAALALWRGSGLDTPSGRTAVRFALLIVVFRFAAPAYALASEGFYQAFLLDQYSEATLQMEEARGSIEEAASGSTDAAQDGSLWQRITGSLDTVSNAADIEGRMDRYAELLGGLAQNVINLSVVFVVQTALLPLLFAWLLFNAVRIIVFRPLPGFPSARDA